MTISRRDFLKRSISGAAVGSLSASQMGNVFAATENVEAWTIGKQINPAIDNKKVVCCSDQSMMTENASSAATFSTQNAALVVSRVEQNMDSMAMRLSGKASGTDAWSTIFQKPSGKEWNETKVAVKVNCINTAMMPHIAIVGKVCTELISLGIPASNITIYDACHNASGNEKYTPYIGNGIPEGVVVSSKTKDGTNITVGDETMKCASVVTGCDILVNCAINKGHSQTNKGGFTLTMKNHTGSMKYNCPTLTQMIDQNMCDTLIGGNVPRQQLCIVDCLWSAKKGPMEGASHLTHRIVMGTFGPLLDVAVARKIREPVMGATHVDSAISTICSSFGFTEEDIEYDEFTPDSAVKPGGKIGTGSQQTFLFRFQNSSGSATSVEFAVSRSSTIDIGIFDAAGRNIRSYRNVRAAEGQFFWDGRGGNGVLLPMGRYIVRIKPSSGRTMQAMIVL